MYEIRDFKDCCYDLGLSDLGFTGAFFTWTNNSVWSKLDRAMVNHEWVQKGISAQVHFNPPRKFSDHSPCYVSLLGENAKRAIPFKFFNMWVKHDNFQSLVRNSWGMRVDDLWQQKRNLQQVQLQLHDNPSDTHLQLVIPELRAKAIKLAAAEMSYCSQLAKAKFLKNSDKGTKFFHNMIKSRHMKRSIPSITLEDGSRSTSNRSGHCSYSPSFGGGHQIRPLQHREDKAPGPNGFSSCFFKKAWDIVGSDFTTVVLGFFSSGERGLRQGDPLSPYFFVLCLEYLSRSLGDLKHNPDFNFHSRCVGLKFSHLAYADDLVLFSRGDPTSVSLIMDKLKYLGDCSGLSINLTKSSFHLAGVSNTDTEIIKGVTRFSQGSFPFRYLGIPVADSRLKIAQYSPMIAKILDSINAWAGATLSYVGRTELIKSVLQGVECFWLSILPIPSRVKSKIVQLCRNFLWSGKCTTNKRSLVALKEVTLPKAEGGLGLRDSKSLEQGPPFQNSLGHSGYLWVQWVH
ncbi:hypothetical protein Acr_15g0019410 [Actinidia rufa]|uniref:Reverse transcriptase domain-containing protein n=1 Tax=Actinidia rufa TaxID=165716 RepID=A0A7J0FXB9_9ERIC|nr:hypothetical protein Acr_15g0019410 [Actinidia rufa]